MDEDPILCGARERVGRVPSRKWRLNRLLGVGGMAALYEASHYNGKRAAVKMLHATYSTWPEVKARFLQEAHAANSVGHAGVVSVLDDGETDDGEACSPCSP
jgi:serine/threonine-protein kinase